MLAILLAALAIAQAAIGPYSTAKPEFTAVNNPLKQPTNLWDSSLKAPYETNAFFENLILGEGKNPINLLPYIIEIDSTSGGLGVGVPTQLVASQKSVLTPYVRDWAI